MAGKMAVCSKFGLAKEHLAVYTLPKNSPAYRHFIKQSNKAGWAFAHCMISKHVICRSKRCAVRKSAQCLSVCPAVHNVEVRRCGAAGRRSCQGGWIDSVTKKSHSFGAVACHKIAMVL